MELIILSKLSFWLCPSHW